MVNSLLMFDALGYADSDTNVRTARASIDKLLMVKEDEAYCQPCLSPVWDTALAAHTLLEVGGPDGEQRALSCLEWLRPLQVLDTVGDWAAARPGIRPGRLGVSIRQSPLPRSRRHGRRGHGHGSRLGPHAG